MKAPVISLFTLNRNMVKPWADAGHPCLIVDIQHPPGMTDLGGNVWALGCDLRAPFSVAQHTGLPWFLEKPAFVAAFPPCDHLAVSGARWFKGKGLRLLSLSIDLFATAAEFCEREGAPYQIENPVSTISTYWRKPDFTFHPWHYAGIEAADNYTKKTCLWTGHSFVMPPPVVSDLLSAPDDRIHKAPPGPDRHNFRSATPMGYAVAVYAANRTDDMQGAA